MCSLAGSAELDSFDPAFFEEIEDLKCALSCCFSYFGFPSSLFLFNRRCRYQHREMQQQAAHYEEMLRHLSERYG